MYKYNWAYFKKNIKDHLWIGKKQLNRSRILQMEYEDHMRTVDSRYLTREDYIKVKYLGYSGELVKNMIVAVPSRFHKDWILVNNAFPYVNGNRIEHKILWSTTILQPKLVDIICKKENKEYLWFINNPETRSVKNLWHCQVFFKL